MRKNKIASLGCSCIFLLLSSCGEMVSVEQTSSSLVQKKSVVVAVSSEPTEGFDPCLGWGRFGNPLIQSRLIYFDETGRFSPDLATAYEVSADGLVLSFLLREDVLFSDGMPLTAHDVAFTFQTAKESGASFDLTALSHMEVVSDYEVRFHLHKPQFTFLYTIAQTGIVPAHGYDATYSDAPVGSGAFVLRQWDKGQQVILTVNELYYGEKPSMEQVTLLFMSEESALSGAKKGVVDVALTSSRLVSQVPEHMEVIAFPTIDNRGISLPVNQEDHPVTSHVAIRKALSYGIDREQLVEDCLGGFGVPAYSECDGMPWSNGEIAVDYSLNYGISLLEEAGWLLNDQGIREKEGVLAEFTLLYNASDSVRQALALSVSQQAQNLGISILPEGTHWNDIQSRMNTTPVVLGFGAENPMETYLLYHSSNSKQDYYNTEGYGNLVVDGYLDLAMMQQTEEEAFSYFQKVQWDGETGVSALGDLPFLWLVNVDHLFFVAEGLDLGESRIHPHGHDYPILSNLAQWEWEISS